HLKEAGRASRAMMASDGRAVTARAGVAIAAARGATVPGAIAASPGTLEPDESAKAEEGAGPCGPSRRHRSNRVRVWPARRHRGDARDALGGVRHLGGRGLAR